MGIKKGKLPRGSLGISMVPLGIPKEFPRDSYGSPRGSLGISMVPLGIP